MLCNNTLTFLGFFTNFLKLFLTRRKGSHESNRYQLNWRRDQLPPVDSGVLARAHAHCTAVDQSCTRALVCSPSNGFFVTCALRHRQRATTDSPPVYASYQTERSVGWFGSKTNGQAVKMSLKNHVKLTLLGISVTRFYSRLSRSRINEKMLKNFLNRDDIFMMALNRIHKTFITRFRDQLIRNILSKIN